MPKIRNLSQRLNAIAADASDEDNYIPADRLVTKFNAELIFRPLLVEAGIARNTKKDGHWYVLIDSKQFPRPPSPDSSKNPWPTRLRATIAHELAHTVAYYPTEFGLDLDTKDKQEDINRSNEQIAIKLSPVLLISEKSATEITTKPTPEKLLEFTSLHNVSRETLILRIKQLEIEHAPKNTFICCLNEKEIQTRPLYYKFENNINPSIVYKLLRKEKLNISDYINEQATPLSPHQGTYTIPAGTEMNPRADRLDVKISIARKNNRGILQIEISDTQNEFQLIG